MRAGCGADGGTLSEFTPRRHLSPQVAQRARPADCTAACRPTASRFDTIARVPR
jgi:hypothetical protein